MEKMELYNMRREVPKEAKKPILAGNLKGYTDINPQWRIKCLTEMFGPVGFGWYTEITEHWTEKGANNEVLQFVKIKLYVFYKEAWSKGIEGTGGSTLINNFSKGLRSNDEALKMAETDAISVACKKLGIAANVYFNNDRTKYNQYDNSDEQKKTSAAVTEAQLKRYFAIASSKGFVKDDIEILDNLVKIAFGITSKKEWPINDYKNFTNYMQNNSKDATISMLEAKINKKKSKT